MGTLNRVPRGLLSLLDSQVQGRNPSEVLESIAPGLEMLKFMTAAKGHVVQQASLTVTGAPGAGSAISVPQGELWLVHLAAVEIVALDAAATTWFPALYATKGGVFVPLISPVLGISTGATGYTGSFSDVYQEPLWLFPGENLTPYMQKFTGTVPVAGVTLRGFAEYTVLAI